jgi:hypothetical protein
LLLVAASCGDGGDASSDAARIADAEDAPRGFRFVDVAAESGLTRVTHAGRPGKDHLLDSAGTGAAWLDYDRDGRLDLYLVNGWLLDGDRVVERGRNALYRNRGDGTFEDVTDAAGVAGAGHWGSGVAVADADDDGWPDLLVTNHGPLVLYRNRGDGTFEDVAPSAGLDDSGWYTGAAFLDADSDGDLDLYVAAYIDCTLDDVLAARRTLDWKGVDKVASGPFGMPGAKDLFFLSDGQGGYAEATEAAGLADRSLGFGFAVLATDIEGDGDADLYIANDSDANYAYRNEGEGSFREVGLWTGAAFDRGGAAQAGMGAAVGDVDGDADLDLFVTNFSEDQSTLYAGDGLGFFEDVTLTAGLGTATYTPLSWGTVLADLDNDGDLDLVIANGHIYPQVDDHPEIGQRYAQRAQLFENDGAGRFTDVTDRAGPGFAVARPARALAAGDYDDDGDIDLLLSNLDAPPTLLRNDSACGSWLIVDCAPPPGRGTAIGTRLTATVGDRTLVREVASSGSYLSAHDPRVHFGLGDATQVDRLVIRWPDGTTTEMENVAPGQIVTARPD